MDLPSELLKGHTTKDMYVSKGLPPFFAQLTQIYHHLMWHLLVSGERRFGLLVQTLQVQLREWFH